MVLKKMIIITVFILLGICIVIFGKMFLFSNNSFENTNVGGVQAKQLSTTEVSISMPDEFIKDVRYIIIKNSNGDAESYKLQTQDTNLKIELKKIKLSDKDKLTVTMYDKNDDALGDYQEL